MQNKDISEVEDMVQKFRRVLRDALQDGKVKLPSNIKTRYAPMLLYRAVRISNDKNNIDDSDFLSQMENLQSKNRQRRTDDSDIENYSCSFFKCVAPLMDAMKLPRKNKKIAKGYVRKEHGACQVLLNSKHVHLFRYRDIEMANEFEVISDEEMDAFK